MSAAAKAPCWQLCTALQEVSQAFAAAAVCKHNYKSDAELQAAD